MISKSLQDTIDEIHAGDTPTQRLRDALVHSSPLVRVNAMEALAARAGVEPAAASALRRAALDPRNRVRLLGTITAADVATACLFRIGDQQSTEMAEDLIARQPEPHRSDLLAYLCSEGLVPETKAAR